MPDEELPPDTPPTDTPPVPETPPPASPAAVQPKVLTIPSASMKTIKAEEYKKGERKAKLIADRQAQELGYRDHEHMVTSLKAAKARKTAPTTSPEPDSAPPADAPPAAAGSSELARLKRLEKENARLVAEKQKLNRARAAAEKAERAAQKKLDAQAAETELRIAASRAGVQDIDYAVHLLRQKLSGLPVNALEAFDENAFFSTELRNTHPYLYGVQDRPADTGPSATPPKGSPPPAPPSNEKVDVRKLSKEEYDAYLRKRGLTAPGLGLPG